MGPKRVTDLHNDLMHCGIKLHPDPAVAKPTRQVQGHDAGEGLTARRMGLAPFQTRHGALTPKSQHGLVIKRRAVRQANAGRALGCAAPAALCGLDLVIQRKSTVELACGGKAAEGGHFSHGQGGVGQQLFGPQQALGLAVLRRGDAQVGVQDAPQMALTHAHARGQGVDLPWARLGVALIHPFKGLVRQHLAGILAGPALGLTGGQLWATPQAGPEPGNLGLCWMGEKLAVSLQRCARCAHRPAVNAGAAHAKVKKPIKACIARAHSLVAGAGAQIQQGVVHAAMLRRDMGLEWSYSDMVNTQVMRPRGLHSTTLSPVLRHSTLAVCG